jgi:cytochrome c
MIKLSRVMPGRLKLTWIAVAAAGSAMVSTANAQDGLDLAKRSGCTACHSTDAKMVGPPFKEVAQKYKGDPVAIDKLVSSIRKGSQGKWGAVPMPPNTGVNDERAQALALWVMGL